MAKQFYIKDDDGNYVEVKAVAQDSFDRILDERYARERERLAKQYADYDDLKTKVSKADEEKAEYQKKLDEATKAAEAAQEQTRKAELKATRTSVIHEYNISDDLADFVTGDDEDEMRSKAEKLKKGIKPSLEITKDPKPKEGEDDKGESAEIAKKLFGKSDD